MKKLLTLTALIVFISINNVALAAENSLSNADFVKLMLNSNGFSPESITEIKYPFIDVPADLAPYTEKLVELRVLDHSENARFNPNAKITLPRALEYSLKYKGIIIPKKAENPTLLKQNFKNINPTSYIAPVLEKALEHDLVKANGGLAPVSSTVSLELASKILKTNSKKSANLKINPIEPKTGISQNPKFDILSNVWNRLNTDYYFSESLNETDLMYGAIKGMVNSINDPYTNFKTPNEAEDFQEDLNNELDGIGASFTQNEKGETVVVTPLKNSPAEKAGLKPKDVLIKVNGNEIKGLKTSEITKLIKGKAGTLVRITVLRNNKELTLNIVRAKINIPSLKTEITNDGIVIFTINNFGAGLETSFKKAISQLSGKNVKAVVIDVRKNPGGYVSSAVHIASHFIKKGEVLAEVKYANAKSKTEISYGYGEFISKPIYVLIDAGTASASEILAAALKEKSNAVLIGEKSFGKGTVQELVSYSDNSMLKLTVANWYTPSGKEINKIGINPDIKTIPSDLDKKLGNDPVLNRALQAARES